MNVLTDILYPSVEEFNENMESEIQLTKEESTPLFGEKALLDSIGLVNFIVTVERNVEEKLDRSITLASEKAFSRRQSPFLTLGTLADYIQELLSEEE